MLASCLYKPIRKKRAVIVWQSAFQAGCREFEFRLPVLDMQEIRSKKERH
jgi:hypothetical protein